MRVVFNKNKLWPNQTRDGIQRGLIEMVTDIHKRATVLAPVDSYALVNSGKITKIDEMEYAITFGSARVPYALRRHYENKKNPQNLRYLEKAGESVARGNYSKFYKDKV